MRSMHVTVVIPAYDASEFIGPAIESVLGQTHRDFELLVVDDGSSDETGSIVETFAGRDDRARLLSQSNSGVAAARNRGIAEATGELVALLDQDDEWLPNKLERQLREFEGGERIAAVGCLMEYVSSRGKVLGVSGESTEGRQEEMIRAEFMPFAPSGLVAPTKLIRALGGFDEHLAKNIPGQVDDLDLVSRLVRHGPVITIPEVLGRYRIHAGGVSARHYFNQRSGMRYLAARVKAREQGRALTWEEFRSEHPPTFQEKRGDLTGYCYRTAGLRVADGRVLSGAVYLSASGILGPRYTARRLMRQRRLGAARLD